MISPAKLRDAAHAARNAKLHTETAKQEMARAAALLGDHVADFLGAQDMEDLEEIPKNLEAAAQQMDLTARAGGIP